MVTSSRRAIAGVPGGWRHSLLAVCRRGDVPILLQHIEVADHSQQLKEEVLRERQRQKWRLWRSRKWRRSGGGYRREYR